MNQLLHLLRTSFLVVFIAIFVLTPTLSSAASTKTYTFTNLSPYTTTGTTTWYSPQWKFRQKITISKDSIGEDLTDFPVVVRLDDVSLTGARDDRHDILFTTSDGTTKLSHELEDNTTAWVKVPKLTPLEDTELYLYYGNPSAEDQQNVSDVWTNGYAAVYHMNDNPEGTIYDSTKNDGDGTASGMEKGNALQSGRIGQSLDFNGVDNYVDLGFTPSAQRNLLHSDFTVCSWINPRSMGELNLGTIIDNYGSNAGGWALLLRSAGADTRAIQFSADFTVDTASISASETINFDTWSHVCAEFNGITKAAVLRQNAQKLSLSFDRAGSGTTLNDADNNMRIGNIRAGTTRTFDGKIDHVTVSDTARSGAWLTAEYKNQVGTEDFLTISDTVETTPHTTTDSSTSTITLKPTHALSFTNLLSFKPNTQPTTTFQLSNDAGKTWLFYTTQGWKPANPSNPLHRSSINDISSHIKSFPVGSGKLVFKAYLQPGSTLDSLSIGYTKGTSTNTASFPQTIIALNSLYRQAYKQDPSFLQWTYWAKRMLTETKTQQEWLGAMMWAAANGK